LTIALAAIFAGAVTISGIIRYRDTRMPNFDRTGSLYVRPSTTAAELFFSLEEQCGLKNRRSLERCLRKTDFENEKKPGHYRIQKGSTSILVARMVTKGWQTPVNLTIAGTIRRPSDLARKISRQMMADSASLQTCFCDSSRLAESGWNLTTVFNSIVPDTYEFYWTDSPEKIFSRLASEADAFWTKERLAKASSLGLDRKKATILASIVDSETNCASEMPLVAGVYLNRLAKGMKLQADPTVAWCYDFKVNRILKNMLAFDSPYNTYKYKGLPPGPICLPSKKALLATLDPDFGGAAVKAGAKGCNLYFCADPSFNGTHRFTSTYKTHMQNARNFQKELKKQLNTKNRQK